MSKITDLGKEEAVVRKHILLSSHANWTRSPSTEKTHSDKNSRASGRRMFGWAMTSVGPISLLIAHDCPSEQGDARHAGSFYSNIIRPGQQVCHASTHQQSMHAMEFPAVRHKTVAAGSGQNPKGRQQSGDVSQLPCDCD